MRNEDDRSVAMEGDNNGIIITGDNNVINNRTL